MPDLTESGELHAKERKTYKDYVNSSNMTPWGKAQCKIVFAPGIVFYDCPGHGGFKVHKRHLKKMEKKFVNADGWYEEDCEANKVIVSFPHLFTKEQFEHAKQFCEKRYDENGRWIHL